MRSRCGDGSKLRPRLSRRPDKLPWSGSWPSLELIHLADSLEVVVRLVVSSPSDQPDEEARALARFLVVRSCGYLEQVSEECCRSFVKSKTIPQVSSYGASWLGRGASPTPAHLVALVRRFDAAWADTLDLFLRTDDELLWREISLLVDRRNKIAHGSSEGITGRKALDLSIHAKSVASWFVSRFDPR